MGAAFDDAAQPAGLPLQVIAQRQGMEMIEDLQCEIADRALRDGCEYRVADFAKGLREHARRAVSQDQYDRHGDGLRRSRPQRVDRLLVEERHIDRDDLGQDQHRQRNDDAQPEALLTFRPQMATKYGHDPPGTRGAHLGNGFVSGRRHDQICLIGRTVFVAQGSPAFYRAATPEVSPPWKGIS